MRLSGSTASVTPSALETDELGMTRRGYDVVLLYEVNLPSASNATSKRPR